MKMARAPASKAISVQRRAALSRKIILPFVNNANSVRENAQY
jgi:hypothetical protein